MYILYLESVSHLFRISIISDIFAQREVSFEVSTFGGIVIFGIC